MTEVVSRLTQGLPRTRRSDSRGWHALLTRRSKQQGSKKPGGARAGQQEEDEERA